MSPILLTEDIIEKACLETVKWWVDCEAKYHGAFTNNQHKHNQKKVFYAFTKKYSVRRTIIGKNQDATNRLYYWLEKSAFKQAMKEKDGSFIDKIADDYEGNNIISLLSKYATLIKPDYYAMYDRNALYTLKAYDNKFKSKKYADFFATFRNFKKTELPKIPSETIDFYVDMLGKRFPKLETKITKEIYKNRLTDKLLWVYADEHNNKK